MFKNNEDEEHLYFSELQFANRNFSIWKTCYNPNNFMSMELVELRRASRAVAKPV